MIIEVVLSYKLKKWIKINTRTYLEENYQNYINLGFEYIPIAFEFGFKAVLVYKKITIYKKIEIKDLIKETK